MLKRPKKEKLVQPYKIYAQMLLLAAAMHLCKAPRGEAPNAKAKTAKNRVLRYDARYIGQSAPHRGRGATNKYEFADP